MQFLGAERPAPSRASERTRRSLHVCAELPADRAGSAAGDVAVALGHPGCRIARAVLARQKDKEATMSYTNSGSAASRSDLLDVDPMIAALQFQPADFELSHAFHMIGKPEIRFGDKLLVKALLATA